MDKKTQVTLKPFGRADGGAVDIFELSNGSIEVTVMNYGGVVQSLRAPDREGGREDVVLGFDSLEEYVANNADQKHTTYFGAIVGRYANRIANGRFTLDGETYSLARNNGPNALHGGPRGFHRVVWDATVVEGGVQLSYLSSDGEEGYPGNLSVNVRYTLAGSDLRIDYSAATDQETVVNLTNHSYFNLSGQGNGDILGHDLRLHASRFTPVDSTLIPTGELRPVAGTPFDFRQMIAIGSRIKDADEQLKIAGGYDHNWVLESGGDGLNLVAEAYEPTTGRLLQVLTTQPGVQFYSGNFLDGSVRGKGGASYPRRSGFCLETQHFPDSPNHPNFPTTVLRAGQRFESTTVFRFSVR
jgi:aldose 1-epimerase